MSDHPARPEMSCSSRPRARDLGIVIGDHSTGPHNAITDVAGVTVGHSTIIRGDGALKVGEGPVRTGVTAVLPRGRDSRRFNTSIETFALWRPYGSVSVSRSPARAAIRRSVRAECESTPRRPYCRPRGNRRREPLRRPHARHQGVLADPAP